MQVPCGYGSRVFAWEITLDDWMVTQHGGRHIFFVRLASRWYDVVWAGFRDAESGIRCDALYLARIDTWTATTSIGLSHCTTSPFLQL